MAQQDNGLQVVVQTPAVLVDARSLGLFISVSIVATSSSVISVLPNFVHFTLHVGTVCPRCRGHIVSIMELKTLSLLIPNFHPSD